LDERLQVKEELSPAGNESEDKSWSKQEELPGETSENG